jgi:hypothetical protein
MFLFLLFVASSFILSFQIFGLFIPEMSSGLTLITIIIIVIIIIILILKHKVA